MAKVSLTFEDVKSLINRATAIDNYQGALNLLLDWTEAALVGMEADRARIVEAEAENSLHRKNDRQKTRELNMLTAENREQAAAIDEMRKALQAFVDLALSEGNRCFFCDQSVYGSNDTGEHSEDCEQLQAGAILTANTPEAIFARIRGLVQTRMGEENESD